jgi:Na+-driven multidrug efflux pump
MFYAGIGMPKQAAILSTARQGYCFIPLIYILPLFFGVTGLCIAQGCADVLNGCILLPMFIKAVRMTKKKEAEQLAEAEAAAT